MYTGELIGIFIAVPVYIVRTALTDCLMTPLKGNVRTTPVPVYPCWQRASRHPSGVSPFTTVAAVAGGQPSLGLIALADHPS